ncbi:uncharacterized protein LOC105664915 [Ceratitis capitata]|uniref:uncharacterized protein LOC105664915 n=1 Tax=Ceratitis capitata TaxID=7213 RepID=UPI00061884F0|nr:uncharacterized protein LOC105664915 [Ceratitis capitata]
MYIYIHSEKGIYVRYICLHLHIYCMYGILYFSDLCGHQSSASLHYLRQLTYSQAQITSLPARQHLASAKLQYKFASIQATRYIIHLTTHGSAPQRRIASQRIAQRFALEKSTSNRRGGYENVYISSG